MSLRILIFSDNGSFTDYLRQLLRTAGHETLAAPDGVEPHRVLRKENPDLVLVAVDGAGAAELVVKQRLQTAKGVRTVPVIVISADLALESNLHHVFDFIPKPLDACRLLEGVAAVEKRAAHHAVPQALSDAEYQELSGHILSCTGLHFESRQRPALQRAVIKRMSPLLMTRCSDYIYFLKRYGESRHELQKLVQLLTVGETYFFRYPSHYRALTAKLQAGTGSASTPIRIWSAGCSTGEEPYTIAMSIMDAIPDWRWRDIRIIATDINSESINKARRGIYTPWSLRSTDPRHIERYFDRTGEGYAVRDEVKGMVRFFHMNLSAPCGSDLSCELQNLDAIFCRNVLIYFSVDKAAEMLKKFTAALKPEGMLFLGHAETMFQRPAEMESRRHENSFYYMKAAGAVATEAGSDEDEFQRALLRALAVPTAVPTAESAVSAVTTVPAVSTLTIATAPDAPGAGPADAAAKLGEARALFDAEQYDASLQVVERLLADAPDDAAALILKGFILASKGRISEALETCSRVIGINDLLPDAYFLKGVLLDACDFLEEAADEYRKALLLDHDFIMPRYCMGRLHLKLGRVTEAEREIRNSIMLLTRQREDATVPYSGGLTRSLCLAQLQSALARVA